MRDSSRHSNHASPDYQTRARSAMPRPARCHTANNPHFTMLHTHSPTPHGHAPWPGTIGRACSGAPWPPTMPSWACLKTGEARGGATMLRNVSARPCLPATATTSSDDKRQEFWSLEDSPPRSKLLKSQPHSALLLREGCLFASQLPEPLGTALAVTLQAAIGLHIRDTRHDCHIHTTTRDHPRIEPPARPARLTCQSGLAAHGGADTHDMRTRVQSQPQTSTCAAGPTHLWQRSQAALLDTNTIPAVAISCIRTQTFIPAPATHG